METYKRWVRRNKDYVHSLESLANGLTWLLPERFSSSEIGPEAVTAVLGIITAVNEHIIETTPTRTHTSSASPSSFPYPLCISSLKDLETLIEVVAQHFYGDDKKWNFIAITEATKVLIRLALFQNTGYKMLLHGGETPNIERGEGDSSSQHRTGPLMKEGRALTALSRFGENARMVSEPNCLRRAQQQHESLEPRASVIERPTLSTILAEKGVYGGLFVMREVLFITRPLIYVLLIRKYGIRSWIPWLISLAMDIIGAGVLSQDTLLRVSRGDKRIPVSVAEKDELRRRKLLWVLYLMRDPFFSKYTRRRLESTEKLLEPVPIIGFLTAKIVELIIGAQTRYTYMSGS